MKKSSYRKNRTINKKVILGLAGSLAVVCVVGIIVFFSYFHVEAVEVRGSTHYTDEEVKKMVLKGPFAGNSVLAPIFCSKKNVEEVFFVDSFSVTRLSQHTICISVIEKKAVGCIAFLDNYIYFDRNGIFVEGSRTRDEKVPYLNGIEVKQVIEDEKLPIKDSSILNTAVALSTIFQKNQMLPDSVQFDDNSQINLIYGDITVKLGKDEYLEDKMARVIAILPQLEGKKGILHLEGITATNKRITFEEEIDPASVKWKGGYDEDGNFTGDGEYDEDGSYVGPNPEGSSGDKTAEESGEESSGETGADSYDDSDENSWDDSYQDQYDESYYDSLYDFDSYDYDSYDYDSYDYDSYE